MISTVTVVFYCCVAQEDLVIFTSVTRRLEGLSGTLGALGNLLLPLDSVAPLPLHYLALTLLKCIGICIAPSNRPSSGHCLLVRAVIT